ncbi:Putative peptidyl-prolyl cis-trans isomerase Cbf2 [Xylophilus ampelinus]|nr:peptidylprolyl isomerase [Variovorax sp.]VTY36749.1 Putative peptidyl-prolyl cis-trans isomerase Cbf2 [Xylophilus ampelinus]|tara:strand:- start:329 stop:1270 length:942 start_codon:yes stop_codon:yes gene_type:complete
MSGIQQDAEQQRPGLLNVIRMGFAITFLTFALLGQVSAQPKLYFLDERDTYHQAHVYHIMFRTEADARETYLSLRSLAGERLLAAFKQAAMTKSVDPGSRQAGGDLGVIREGTMVRPFEVASFTTPPGSISAPTQTQFGWHLVYVQSSQATPVARVCGQVLDTYAKTAKDALSEAVALSRNYKPSASSERAIQKILGPSWGPALRNQEGTLTFLQIGGKNAAGSVRIVEHTEHPFARLQPSPLSCTRSQRTQYIVNCQDGTVQMQATEERELRGGLGRVMNRREMAPEERDKSTYGGFFKQIRDLACRSDTKT